jgi:3,4-dihydroxy 2-butanone 4-phosphate synthase/GTP cyclohydrolase II
VYAREHDLKMGTIEDLIRYRIENEKTVEHVAESELATEYGNFRVHAYHDSIDGAVHLALVLGEIQPGEPTLVRVQLHNTLRDLIDVKLEGEHWPLRQALQRVAQEGKGVVVILRPEEPADALLAQIKAYHVPEQAARRPTQKKPDELRTYGVGAQIIADLGIQKMRVLSAPKIVHGIAGFGLEVVEYVS